MFDLFMNFYQYFYQYFGVLAYNTIRTKFMLSKSFQILLKFVQQNFFMYCQYFLLIIFISRFVLFA